MIDVEDQPPEFVLAPPVTRISEDSPVGTVVLQGGSIKSLKKTLIIYIAPYNGAVRFTIPDQFYRIGQIQESYIFLQSRHFINYIF